MGVLNLIEIFSILTIHFISDFVLQTDKQAKGKSKNWGDLLSHTITYSLCFGAMAYCISFAYLVIMYFFVTKQTILSVNYHMYWFIPITFICHTITDYFTSRLNSKLWSQGKVHEFFVSVGFDQLLHYIQLFLTYYLLKSI